MIDYENVKVEREHSKYPRGLKHFAKDTLAENSLFDFELVKYKLMALLKGVTNDEKENTKNGTEDKESAEEIC